MGVYLATRAGSDDEAAPVLLEHCYDPLVYFYADDPACSVTVIIQRGVSDDAEQARYIDAFVEFDKRGRTRATAPVFVLVAERSAVPPDAKWRQRIAEASRNAHPRALVVFVVESTVARGAITAINWIRPPPFSFTVARDIHEAVAWLEPRRPDVRPIVLRLYHDARLAADVETRRQASAK